MNRFWKNNLGRVAAMASLVFAIGATAQTTPNSNNKTDGGTMDAPPPRATERTTTTTTTTQENSAWQRFDETRSAEMGLDKTQSEQLREIDDRYDRELRALGDDPMNAPGYNDLRERRDKEVRGVLTEEQYERYSTSRTTTTPASPK